MDFENIDEFIETVEQPTVTDTLQKEYDKDLYKKWFRSKTQSGFLSIKPWYQGLKFKVDIGKTSADGKLLSSTMVYLDAIDFSASLNSVNTACISAVPTAGTATAPSFATNLIENAAKRTCLFASLRAFGYLSQVNPVIEPFFPSVAGKQIPYLWSV